MDLLRENDLFSHLAIHIILLRAQSAHLLGQETAAGRYYRAGLANLVPGSELGLVFQIGLLGLTGQMEDIPSRPEAESQVREIIDKVRLSTNSGLVGVGHFLSSLLDTGAHAKYVPHLPVKSSLTCKDETPSSIPGISPECRQVALRLAICLSRFGGRLG